MNINRLSIIFSFTSAAFLSAALEAQGGRGGGGSTPPADPAIAYVRSGAKSNLEVMNSDGSNQRALLRGCAAFPSMAPDGREVAFACLWNGVSGVHAMKSDGTGLRVVTATNYTHRTQGAPLFIYPRWSPVPAPDGQRKLLFADMIGPAPAEFQLYVINIDGTGRQQLTADPAGVAPANEVEWSPDATRIVFRERTGSLQVGQLAVVGGQLALSSRINLIDGPGHPLAQATRLSGVGWANTADVVVVSAETADSGGRLDLWLLPLSSLGTAVRLTATTGADERNATFSPDDTRIYYHHSSNGTQVMRSDGVVLGVVNRAASTPYHRRQ